MAWVITKFLIYLLLFYSGGKCLGMPVVCFFLKREKMLASFAVSPLHQPGEMLCLVHTRLSVFYYGIKNKKLTSNNCTASSRISQKCSNDENMNFWGKILSDRGIYFSLLLKLILSQHVKVKGYAKITAI